MKCPKCSKAELVDETLDRDLAVKHCRECKGHWIPAESYATWQEKQSPAPAAPDALLENLNIAFGQSPLDTRAALCPECQRYLSRAKIKLKTPFFIDRCNQCGGVWCDCGEWDILAQLGLHTAIEQLFERKWQMQMREQQQVRSEQQSMAEKMGPELAEQIFAIADSLSQHPHGEFALAYLMRKVIESHEALKRGGESRDTR